MGKTRARSLGRELRETERKEAYFAIYDDRIVASGTSERFWPRSCRTAQSHIPTSTTTTRERPGSDPAGSKFEPTSVVATPGLYNKRPRLTYDD